MPLNNFPLQKGTAKPPGEEQQNFTPLYLQRRTEQEETIAKQIVANPVAH